MRKSKISYITAIGLMAALVFIGSQFSITVPVYVGGSPSRIHFGNIFCLFAGFILGPVGGGLSAGIGSAFYDFSNPIYAASAPFTFVFKFLMAYVCGKIAYSSGKEAKNFKRNIIAGICGILTYMVCYLTKSFITDVIFVKMELPAAFISLTTRAMTSSVNGIIAVAVAVPLGLVIMQGLERSNLMDRIRYTVGTK